MRILLVEDDPLLGDGLHTALKRDGHAVDWLTDGQQAAHALHGESFELVLLDLSLPRRDGLSLLRQWRADGHTLPILILTARDTVEERVQGLDLGADDYLVKPFELAELRARIRALHRRAQGSATPLLRHGALELDPGALTVRWHGEQQNLPRRELMVLQVLMERQGRTVSREQLEQLLYGWDDAVGSNAVEVHIHHLRKRFGNELIRTVRGLGYTLDPAK